MKNQAPNKNSANVSPVQNEKKNFRVRGGEVDRVIEFIELRADRERQDFIVDGELRIHHGLVVSHIEADPELEVT